MPLPTKNVLTTGTTVVNANNIFGQNNTLGSITTSTSTRVYVQQPYTNSSTWTTYSIKEKYNLLGEEIEVDISNNTSPVWNLPADLNKIIVSLINLLGVEFFDEMVKNNFDFSGELGKKIKDKMKSQRREQKISKVINE